MDLKIRSPNFLKEKAESMSKPFPYHGKPLSWNDIIDVVGRTDAEMNDLVTKITTNLGGIEIKTCPSKQCIIVDVNVDVSDDEMFLLGAASIDDSKHSSGGNSNSNETVADFLHRSLRRILNESGTDHTIINGITRLAMPDDPIDGDEFRNKRRSEYDLYDDEDEDAGPSPAHQNNVFQTIYSDIQKNRKTKLTKEGFNKNGLMFLLIPAICAVDSETGYISMENSDQQKSCPTEIKVTASPWYAKDLAVSENITYTFSTEGLEQTDMCSQYNGTVSRLADIKFKIFTE